ncbi:MAG TPA: hypothetical protein VIW27_00240 [Gammaproteobacteria bacterium]
MRGIVKLQIDAAFAGEVSTGIEQVRLAAGGAAPQADLRLAIATQQRLETADDQLVVRANEISEAELAIERQRKRDLFNCPPRGRYSRN